MNLKFVVNDYVLIWNLLFQASISENVHKLKQKIWINYKNEYNKTFSDNVKILRDPKNFIPDDDTVYNIILENKDYEKLRKNTDKFRVKLLNIWDEHKRKTVKSIKDILRVDIEEYCVLVVSPELNIIDTEDIKNQSVNAIVWGKNIDTKNSLSTIIRLVYEIVRKEMRNYNSEYKDIVDAVIELAVINEFATRLSGISYYLTGKNSLKYLKKQIYPYWLMYLGIEKEEMSKYMTRDNVYFDVNYYKYQRHLRKEDIYGFIDFCIKNQNNIIEIEELEVL